MSKEIFLSIFFSVICISGFCYDALELFSGWISADVREEGHYEGVPLVVAFDFSARSGFKKAGLSSEVDDFSLVVEPFITIVSNPDSNIEVGMNFLIKYLIPLKTRIRPYVKGGIGMLYMSQHTEEQSTQVNFLPQIGAGVHYFVKADRALSVEYRFRHLSNAGIRQPNKGIDCDVVLFGISSFF